MIINVASYWGFTYQYYALNELIEKLKVGQHKFAVLVSLYRMNKIFLLISNHLNPYNISRKHSSYDMVILGIPV